MTELIIEDVDLDLHLDPDAIPAVRGRMAPELVMPPAAGPLPDPPEPEPAEPPLAGPGPGPFPLPAADGGKRP
jgi:hypothetical protein